jgi:hypothetical protein
MFVYLTGVKLLKYEDRDWEAARPWLGGVPSGITCPATPPSRPSVSYDRTPMTEKCRPLRSSRHP